MTRSTYPDRHEAMHRAIIEPIEAGDATAEEFDVDQIFSECFEWDGAGYVQTASVEDFWASVQRNAR